MQTRRNREAAEKTLTLENSEITLPFRIVCSRRESLDAESRPLELKLPATGKSLLEPRGALKKSPEELL
jgi:hypothetical protein